MSYIFMDESGDLGFDFAKPKTSNYFVVTFLFAKEKRPVSKIIRKIVRDFTKKERIRHRGVLHCHSEKPLTRRKILGLLNEKDIAVISIYLNKRKVYTKLQNEKQVLYNYVTNILLDRVYTKAHVPMDKSIHLIASKRETNKFFNENFKSYLTGQVKNRQKAKISIEIKTPAEEKCLQVADFVCWAIYRRIEHGDQSYWDIIKDKIVEENPLFP